MRDRQKGLRKKKARRATRVAKRSRKLASSPSPPQAVHDLDAAYDQVVDRFWRLDVPGVLYHYTDWIAFERIITSARFRATAHHCTNDPGELVSADAASRSAAMEILAATPPGSSMLLRHFLADYDDKKLSNMSTSYLTCFSEARDDRGQWERYGAKGSGVCIGVRTLSNESLDDALFARSILKVVYDGAGQERALVEAFRKISGLYTSFVARKLHLETTARRWGWNALFRLAAHAAMSTKTSGWSSEREWRQVAFPQKGANVVPIHCDGTTPTREHVLLEMRSGGRSIAIAEVILGSKQDLDAGEQRARKILESAGYGRADLEMPIVSRSTA